MNNFLVFRGSFRVLLPVLKKPPPVPPKPPTEQGRSKNSTPPVSGWYL